MRELFRERDIIKVGYYQSLLESFGIATFVKNENLSTIKGALTPEFFPALCILNDSDYKLSSELIREHLNRVVNVSLTEKVCEICGEMVPENFDSCWNCNSPIHPKENEEA